MSKEIKIDERYLEELMGIVSSKVVGKIMKRFEIIENKDTLKKSVKELIYEGFRDFRDLLIAHDKGLFVRTFKFNRQTKKDLTQKEE